MALKQPNTICKNRDCRRGADGGRKHYYSCRFCVRTENWRSVACCWECYTAYLDQVREARSRHEPVDLAPERTDLTRDEWMELMRADEEQVIRETEVELAAELAEHPAASIPDIVDEINAQLDTQAFRRTKKVKQSG